MGVSHCEEQVIMKRQRSSGKVNEMLQKKITLNISSILPGLGHCLQFVQILPWRFLLVRSYYKGMPVVENDFVGGLVSRTNKDTENRADPQVGGAQAKQQLILCLNLKKKNLFFFWRVMERIVTSWRNLRSEIEVVIENIITNVRYGEKSVMSHKWFSVVFLFISVLHLFQKKVVLAHDLFCTL